MSKKLGLNIGGRHFDVDVDDKFALFLEHQMRKDFNMDGGNDMKLLLQAYVRKNHEIFIQEQMMKDLLRKIES